ncbi:hypothetical protein CC2G_014841 [Coprinopsis cinerea AmutBmut pab1-1]|nr:hypothetical protein CC2G_014841 [Coprinopsis cinerea AmutBmut pab1-1]
MGDAQESRTTGRQTLDGSLKPLRYSGPLEERGSQRKRRAYHRVLYPDYNGTEIALPVLGVRLETSGLDGGVPDLAVFQHVPDLGSQIMPGGPELWVENAMDGLGRDVLDTTLRNTKLILEKV